MSTKNNFGKLSPDQKRAAELKKLNDALSGNPPDEPKAASKKPS